MPRLASIYYTGWQTNNTSKQFPPMHVKFSKVICINSALPAAKGRILDIQFCKLAGAIVGPLGALDRPRLWHDVLHAFANAGAGVKSWSRDLWNNSGNLLDHVWLKHAVAWPGGRQKRREREQTQRIRKSNALLVGRLRRFGCYRL